MLPVSSKAGGTCAAFPDVCKVPAPPAPPVPTPFPNTARVSCASGTVSKVLISNKETVVNSSKISSSNGDEPGTLGGMVSNVNRGQVAFKTASSKVYAAGEKMVWVSAVCGHNGSNANIPIGAQVAPSQTKVLAAL